MPKRPSDEQFVNFSVRIPSAHRSELERIAKLRGVEVSDCIRWAVTAFIDYVELHGDAIHLPIDFGALWQNIADQAARQGIEDFTRRSLNEGRGPGKDEETPRRPTNYRREGKGKGQKPA